MTVNALPTLIQPKFFEVGDGGAHYSIVAKDVEHAKQLLRECRVEFTDDNGDTGPIDDPRFADIEWKEISPANAARVRVSLGDSGAGPHAMLAECKVGDWFTSEI